MGKAVEVDGKVNVSCHGVMHSPCSVTCIFCWRLAGLLGTCFDSHSF